MSDYAVFFDYNNKSYRLPVNPEQIETNSVQAIEKYEILKLGQIAVPTHMELTEYSFETELPHEYLHYVEKTSEDSEFRDAGYYLNKFKKWRDKLIHVRFVASNGIGDDINSLVLIEELTMIEKAGEEGDKYVSFKLLEYRPYAARIPLDIVPATGNYKKKNVVTITSNPKNTGSYVVKSGDTLWSIAKKYYGDGNQYTKIYNANKDKIKNPGVIQTGWKLVIPT